MERYEHMKDERSKKSVNIHETQHMFVENVIAATCSGLMSRNM
jgi:hypothetical protein